MLTPLERLTPLTPVNEMKDKKEVSEETGIFGAIFRSAIDNVKETDADFKESQYLLATGQLDNPAAAMIAATKSATAVDLLIQLRNKAMDAYSELTRISL